MKYIIVVKLNTGTELVFRVKAEDSKQAVSKVMCELTDIQSHYMTDIQVIKETVYKEL